MTLFTVQTIPASLSIRTRYVMALMIVQKVQMKTHVISVQWTECLNVQNHQGVSGHPTYVGLMMMAKNLRGAVNIHQIFAMPHAQKELGKPPIKDVSQTVSGVMVLKNTR